MIKKVMLLIFSICFCAWNVSAQTNPSKGTSKWHSVLIQTSGTCAHCKQKIESALKAENGVKSVNYDLVSGKVKVVFNSRKVSSKQLRDAINRAGFDADNQKVNSAQRGCGSAQSCSLPGNGGCGSQGNGGCGGCGGHH